MAWPDIISHAKHFKIFLLTNRGAKGQVLVELKGSAKPWLKITDVISYSYR